MSSHAGESSRPSKAKVRQQNISLFPLERAALRLLAKSERNENKSAVVARLLDAEMVRVFGEDWRASAPLDHATRDTVEFAA